MTAPSLKHTKVVSTPDDGTSEVGSDEWNAEHTMTCSSGAVLGRLSAGSGAVEELTRSQVNFSFTRVAPVQDVIGTNTSSNNKTVVLSATPASGNIIVLVTGISAAATVSGITQTGVTWAKKASSSTLVPTMEIWVGVVGAGAGTSILVGFSGTAFNSVYAAEFSGYTGALDQSSGSSATTTGYFTDTITPTGDNLIVAAMGTSNGATPFIAVNNWESKSFGAQVCPMSVSFLSGNGTMLGTMNVSVYQTNAPTRACYSSASGNHSSVIASFT